MEKKKIMVVDDNVTNLNVARSALENHYDVYLMPSGEKALKVMTKIKPDLILLDVEMPVLDGFGVIGAIKELGSPYNEIPVIFVTVKDDTNSEFEGLDLGAVDYIIKPFSFPLLLKRVELHLQMAEQQKQLQNYSRNLESMVEQQISTIQNLQYAIVSGMADVIERRDGSTGSHVIRTSEYLKVLLKKAQENNVYNGAFSNMPIEEYAHASKLHDIGKIAIPDHILLKPGKLTFEEFEVIKTHTTVGEKIVTDIMKFVDDSAFLSLAVDFVKSHHEKWDGSGYPYGLKGEEIPVCGRLMAIADVYDALISKRVYKSAFTHENAVQIMYDGEGTHFDPVLIGVFREVEQQFKEISEIHSGEDTH